ncbi:MAG: hypothetical protein IPM84_12750 [Anaerolineae bacterium]|nr:hypothetical protein [Anaerolineae bacterium]
MPPPRWRDARDKEAALLIGAGMTTLVSPQVESPMCRCFSTRRWHDAAPRCDAGAVGLWSPRPPCDVTRFVHAPATIPAIDLFVRMARSK